MGAAFCRVSEKSQTSRSLYQAQNPFKMQKIPGKVTFVNYFIHTFVTLCNFSMARRYDLRSNRCPVGSYRRKTSPK